MPHTDNKPAPESATPYPLPNNLRQQLIQLGSKCCNLRAKIEDCRDTSKLPDLHERYTAAQEKLALFEAQLQGARRE